MVRAVIAGLAKYFPECRAVLVNSDGGSTDGTPDVVAKASVDLGIMLITDRQGFLHRIITPYKGISGKGSAFRTIFMDEQGRVTMIVKTMPDKKIAPEPRS